MKNEKVRELIRLMANDAKDALDDPEDIEIVERHEEEIVAYIEALERDK